MTHLSGYPDVTDKSVKRVYIKNGRRKMGTSDGYMVQKASTARRMFGKAHGGKYGVRQGAK